MRRIEDIKEFKDIDTYYEISEIVNEVFQDRVEAHKHLVTANKEIERLNNIINECSDEILKELEENHHLSYGVALAIRQKLIDYRELKESDKNVRS